MIRPFTCLCVALAGASGLYLYSEKHRTTLLDQQISKIVAETQATRERTSMVRAEWALLNQPDRLQSLATRFLPKLQPMAPTQFVQLASLAQRLPAREQPKAAPEAEALAPAETMAPAPAQNLDQNLDHGLDQLPEAAPAPLPAPAEDDGIPMASAVPERAAPAQLATVSEPARAASEAAPHHGVQLAQAEGAPHRAAVQPAFRAAAPRHLPHAVLPPVRYAETEHNVAPVRQAMAYQPSRPLVSNASAYARPAGTVWAQPRPVAWHPQAVAYAAPALGGGYGSALGGAHAALPPPVPVGN